MAMISFDELKKEILGIILNRQEICWQDLEYLVSDVIEIDYNPTLASNIQQCLIELKESGLVYDVCWADGRTAYGLVDPDSLSCMICKSYLAVTDQATCVGCLKDIIEWPSLRIEELITLVEIKFSYLNQREIAETVDYINTQIQTINSNGLSIISERDPVGQYVF
jgi:Fe2+ or Zn2+ uptake regulation protein